MTYEHATDPVCPDSADRTIGCERQTWYFTFGPDHEFANRYFVVDDATYEEARQRMLSTFGQFGQKWAFQYDEGQWYRRGVSRRRLRQVRKDGDARTMAELTPADVPAVQDAIRRLCELQSLVSANAIGYDHPNDCFCGESGYWPLEHPEDWRNDLSAIEFIETAVREKLRATAQVSDA